MLNLPGLSDPLSEERSHPTQAITDVLWYPTGGGKTEAYLGLTAYTLAMRRLQGKVGDYDGSAGVAVLMRYTLRLLTLQQFQRAAALICACESIRRENSAKWGNEPFRIGLWVGQRSTPNWNSESDEIVKEYRKTGYFRSTATGGQGSPHQLTNCPWCGAPISQGYPNPDGKFPDPSGDFVGQGAANLATSFFRGMPCGGSLSGTSMVVNAGARSRWANFLVGVLIAVTILLFADLVKLIAMPALAGLLIVIGFRTLDFVSIRTVWQTGILPRAVMLITLVGTLVMPLQFAVLLGVGLSILLFIFHQANRLTLVELIPPEKGAFPIEQPAPRRLPDHKVTVLYPYGSLFYATAKTFEEKLPAAEESRGAVVLFLFRGYERFGSTMIAVLDRYNQVLQANGGKLMLAGVSPGVLEQLERTGLLDKVGRENIYLAQSQWGVAANDALEAALVWLENAKPETEQQEGLLGGR